MRNSLNGHGDMPPLGGYEATPEQRRALEAQLRLDVATNPTNSALDFLTQDARARVLEASLKVPLEGPRE